MSSSINMVYVTGTVPQPSAHDHAVAAKTYVGLASVRVYGVACVDF